MNIYEKLAAVQQATKAPKNQKNTHLKYNYRSAEGILEAVKPFLADNKATITLSDEIVEIGGRIYVKATAQFIDCDEAPSTSWNAEGITIKTAFLTVTAYAREADTKPGLDVAQVTGSASSYARKYALNGLLLLDDAKQDPDTEENTRRVEQAEKEQPKEETQPITVYASAAQIELIRELADKAGVDLNSIGEDVEKMTSRRAEAMITALNKKIQNEA